jgi:hypothetical protein
VRVLSIARLAAENFGQAIIFEQLTGLEQP